MTLWEFLSYGLLIFLLMALIGGRPIISILLLFLIHSTVEVKPTFYFLVEHPLWGSAIVFTLFCAIELFFIFLFGGESNSSQPKPPSQPKPNNYFTEHYERSRKAAEEEAKRIDDYRRITGQR